MRSCVGGNSSQRYGARQHVRLNGHVLLARISKSGCSELASCGDNLSFEGGLYSALYQAEGSRRLAFARNGEV
jgi:hypothetical protein